MTHGRVGRGDTRVGIPMGGPRVGLPTRGRALSMPRQVLAILRTSEGKSLLYLLPCQLSGAGTTILVLPLVVLKTEIQRRCAEARIEAHI